MTNTRMVEGCRSEGDTNQACTILVWDTPRGSWYVVQGGRSVNKTHDEITTGTSVDSLSAVRTHTVDAPIHTVEGLVDFVCG